MKSNTKWFYDEVGIKFDIRHKDDFIAVYYCKKD